MMFLEYNFNYTYKYCYIFLDVCSRQQFGYSEVSTESGPMPATFCAWVSSAYISQFKLGISPLPTPLQQTKGYWQCKPRSNATTTINTS